MACASCSVIAVWAPADAANTANKPTPNKAAKLLGFIGDLQVVPIIRTPDQPRTSAKTDR